MPSDSSWHRLQPGHKNERKKRKKCHRNFGKELLRVPKMELTVVPTIQRLTRPPQGGQSIPLKHPYHARKVVCPHLRSRFASRHLPSWIIGQLAEVFCIASNDYPNRWEGAVFRLGFTDARIPLRQAG